MKTGKQIRNVLTPQEVMAIGMGLGRIIEDLEEMEKTPGINWTAEAISIQSQMLSNAKSAASKIEQMTGFACKLDPYQEGDEKDFVISK